MEKRRKSFNELSFTDDFIFCEVMQNTDLAKRVIEAVMERPINKLEKSTIQSHHNGVYGGKSVRFDVEFIGDNAVYDIEMQTQNHGDLLYRTRYYQAMIDKDYLSVGEDYIMLPESVIIFFCTFDPFGAGLPRYTQRPCLLELGDKFKCDNGTTIYYLNSSYWNGTVNKELAGILAYMADDMAVVAPGLASDINDEVITVLNTKGIGERYMRFDELLREERHEGRQEGIRELAEALGMTYEEACQRLKKTGAIKPAQRMTLSGGQGV